MAVDSGNRLGGLGRDHLGHRFHLLEAPWPARYPIRILMPVWKIDPEDSYLKTSQLAQYNISFLLSLSFSNILILLFFIVKSKFYD